MGFWDSLWSGIKSGASSLWSGIKNVAGNVWNKVAPVIRMIPFVGNKIASGVESGAGAINSGVNALGNLVSGNFRQAGEDVRDAYNKGKEGIEKLTTLKRGGMVEPRKMFQKTK
jgi:phage-related protein